mgnify:CR=1 FL=1
MNQMVDRDLAAKYNYDNHVDLPFMLTKNRGQNEWMVNKYAFRFFFISKLILVWGKVGRIGHSLSKKTNVCKGTCTLWPLELLLLGLYSILRITKGNDNYKSKKSNYGYRVMNYTNFLNDNIKISLLKKSCTDT